MKMQVFTMCLDFRNEGLFLKDGETPQVDTREG